MKKLNRKGERFKGQTLGLDIHKKFIEYCVLDGEETKWRLGASGSSREELQGLVVKLKKQGAVQASLEACGCFIYWVFDLLVQGTVARSRPCQPGFSRIHVIANSMEKNDANDAVVAGVLAVRRPAAGKLRGGRRDAESAHRRTRIAFVHRCSIG